MNLSKESKIIVHVSDVNISLNGGMGRVEYYWKLAFEKAGYTFIHIGSEEVGKMKHKGLFPYMAYSFYKKLNINPLLFIVHEPASGVFLNKGVPVFVESHGLERPTWENDKKTASLKTRIFYPLWRIRNCDLGLKYATKLLLINSDDSNFAQTYYKRNKNDIFLFKNGVIYKENDNLKKKDTKFVILFNGSWIRRKGIETLVSCAEFLYNSGFTEFHYLLIGTGYPSAKVLEDWPAFMHPNIEIISSFNAEVESEFLRMADLFVLPSFSEGQPLSLLQAMASGKCCITTNCCGQKDLIQHNKNGILFEPGNVDELAKQIVRCYHDKHLVSRIETNCKAEMKNRTWESVANEVVNFTTNFLKMDKN